MIERLGDRAGGSPGAAVIERLGDRAVRFAKPAAPARAIVREIRSWPGVIDVVVAADEIAVYFEGSPVIDPARVDALGGLLDDAEPAREVTIEAIYDGPDLDDISRATGVGDVAGLHASIFYTVEFMGFAPGFAYMTALPSQLQLPRRATPRTRVPAGSLAIATHYTAVYPFDSPGGWHLIGRVAEPMFGPDGARLQLGDRVRFVPR
jgi:KipI family sensor histidine kinase inhibitor